MKRAIKEGVAELAKMASRFKFPPLKSAARMNAWGNFYLLAGVFMHGLTLAASDEWKDLFMHGLAVPADLAGVAAKMRSFDAYWMTMKVLERCKENPERARKELQRFCDTKQVIRGGCTAVGIKWAFKEFYGEKTWKEHYGQLGMIPMISTRTSIR